MTETHPRLGALDSLVVQILKDLIPQLDDKWLDAFEDLVEIAAPDDDEDSEEAMDRFYNEVDKLQDRVCTRVGKALINYGSGKGNEDRLICEMNRQFDAERYKPDSEKPPHTIIVYTGEAPAAHLVRQV
jgi:hypothetical protein